MPIAANLDTPQAAYEADVQVITPDSNWGTGTIVGGDAPSKTLRLTLDLEDATRDAVPTSAENTGCQRTVDRVNGLWTLGSGVDRFTY